MADRKPAEASPLVDAARAFDETLQRFAALAQAVGRAALDSAEGLGRAAESLRKVAACEEDLQGRAQALSAALTAARQAQEGHAEAIRTRALEVQRRGEAYAALVGRFEAIGREAADLNAAAQKLAAEHKIDRGMRAEEITPVVSALEELEARMGGVVAAGEALQGDARGVGFDDLARKTDALRQQLLAARNRVGLLREALTRAVPRALSS
ncbi:MAG TPA: hypothetical protein VHO06_18190 [Polyangia bacterium]|nr:hypothetical protein [Polyangia bacterium]